METSPEETAYDRYGEAYRSWWAPIIRPAAVRLLDRLDGRVDGRAELVDVGTGTGTLALAALDRWPGVRATGVDPSRVMLEMAAEDARSRGEVHARRCTWLAGTADRIPMADAAADVVVSSFVVQLVPSRVDALREMWRVLRPGGQLAVLTWLADDEPFEAEDQVWLAFDELEVEVPEREGDRQPYASPAAAARELRKVGFRRASPRLEWLEHRFTPSAYLGVVEHWIEDDVFATLSESRRRDVRSAILTRLERLGPGALTWRRPLVSVLAQRP